MLAAKRHQFILQELQTKKSVSVIELAQKLKVTPMTIRRDMKSLEKKGLLEKSYGGAVLTESSLDEVSYKNRKSVMYEEKLRISQAAMKFVEADMCVLLDAGTTNYELAKMLVNAKYRKLTLVTNDPAIAQLLQQNSNYTVILIGGLFDADSESVCGSYAAKMVLDFAYDICFVGTQAINEQWKVMTVSENKVSLKQNYLKNSRLKVLTVDSSKFDKHKIYNICAVQDFNVLITDKKFTASERHSIGSAVKVISV